MRGKLPRSYKLAESDSEYQYAHLYDAALSIIATVGLRNLKPTLADEIVAGVLLSDVADAPEGSVPIIGKNLDASIISDPDYALNKVNAIVTYALGFYLELYPSAPQSCAVVKTLRQLLAYLESQRDFVYKQGLIKAGIDSNASPINEAYTEDNLLAYFAFKQASTLLNEPNYLLTAIELKTAIDAKLINNGLFRKGLTATGGYMTGDSLIQNVLGAFYFAETGNTTAAIAVLTHAESFKIVDSALGVEGYRAGTTGNRVWFEGSFAMALAYFKASNQNQYKKIINELNKYKDVSDGSFVGSIQKDSTDASKIDLKAVGSTSWALIANFLKSPAFSIRTNQPITGCPSPHFNQVQSGSFTREGCASGYTQSNETYTVRAGRHISYVDQTAANTLAIIEITAYGQLNANINGICQGQVGNEEQSGIFYSTQCQAGYTPIAYEYVVPADTYFAGTLTAANQLAVDDIVFNGQNEADTNGQCQLSTLNIFLYVSSVVYNTFGADDVYLQVSASQPVTDSISIQLVAQDSMGNSFVTPGAYIQQGNYSSGSLYMGSFAQGTGNAITFLITTVYPNPDNSGTNYSF